MIDTCLMAFPCIPPLSMCIHQHRPPCTHLFQHKNTVSRADELRQFSNASLVQVRPRETAVVEIDFRAAVFPIPRSCTHILSVSTWDRWHRGVRSGDLKQASSPVSDWLAVCCLTASGDDAFGGARLSSDQS